MLDNKIGYDIFSWKNYFWPNIILTFSIKVLKITHLETYT